MTYTLDHIIIAVPDLDQAMDDFRTHGFTVNYGGRHASNTTHNALIVFADSTYLELMALTGDEPVAGMADYSPYVRKGSGVVGYALRADDLDATVTALRGRNVAMNDPVHGVRQTATGDSIEWRMANLTERDTPFFITDVTPLTMRVPDAPDRITHANGTQGIAALTLPVPDIDPTRVDDHIKLYGTEPASHTADHLTINAAGWRLTLDATLENHTAITLATDKAAREIDLQADYALILTLTTA